MMKKIMLISVLSLAAYANADCPTFEEFARGRPMTMLKAGNPVAVVRDNAISDIPVVYKIVEFEAPGGRLAAVETLDVGTGAGVKKTLTPIASGVLLKDKSSDKICEYELYPADYMKEGGLLGKLVLKLLD